MRFLVLGPLEVIGEGGDPVPIAGSKERTILAYLVARAPLVVSVDDLIEELWGNEPPRTAEKTIGSYVSRLRRALENGAPFRSGVDLIAARGDGYSLVVTPDDVDAAAFERVAEEGREALGSGDAERATKLLDDGLGLWRGDAYQGLRYTGFGAAEADRLEELRRGAVEDRIDARLAFGASGSLVAELEGLVREAPLRERRWGQLMVALYRSGRQAEALGAYKRARAVLVDELGVEPGPDLQRIHTAILRQDITLAEGPSTGAVRKGVCPYKGLARFERADAEFFFGREQLEADGIALLVGGSFLGLIGASGSGKSSLLRAGLLDALANGAIPGSDGWSFGIMRPGQHPIGSLCHAVATVSGGPSEGEPEDLLRSVAASSGDGRFVIAIDQFEEAFTACDDEVERTRFLDAITEASRTSDGRVVVLLAMRADHYGRCAEHRGLASLLATSQLLVGPMSANDLRSVIELPARRAGLSVQPELTEALIADVVGRPGGLPLLSTALLELWQRRRDGSLTLDAYVRSGGVNGAVGRLAEEAFARLDPAEQAAARRILMRLAASGRGDEVVGRRAALSEFSLEGSPSSSAALDALSDARLVTVSEGSIEVAHEALFREWPRLRDWLEEDAEGRRLHRHLSETATAWHESGRDMGDLYRGARLTAALDWAEPHEPDLNELERAFLDTSRTASEGEAGRARRANIRLRGLLVGVAALLTLSLIVGNLAIAQRNRARAAAAVADARQLASRSLLEDDLILSLLLAREAVSIYDAPETRSALLAALQRAPALIGVVQPTPDVWQGDGARWTQLSSDGHTLAVGDGRALVRFFDAETLMATGDFTVDAGAKLGALSPDARTLAIVTEDSELLLVDVASETYLVGADATSVSDVKAIAAIPNSNMFVTSERRNHDSILVIRDADTLQPTGPDALVRGTSITAAAVSSDGRWLVTTGPEGETLLWTARGLRQVGRFPVVGNGIALSPDGRTAALVQNRQPDGTGVIHGRVVFLDIETGEVRTRTGHRGPGELQGEATGVTYSPDGTSVITTGNDARILVWDVATATIRDDPAISADPLYGPAFSPDGSTAYVAARSGAVLILDMEGDRRIDHPFEAGRGTNQWSPSFALSPDGRTIAALEFDAQSQNTGVHLVDAVTLVSLGRIRYQDGDNPQGVALSPDGRTLAVSSYDFFGGHGYVRLWDLLTLRPDGPPLPGIGRRVAPWAPAFSPDGRTLAAGARAWNASKTSDGGRIYLWDVESRTPLGDPLVESQVVTQVLYSRTGSLVASTGISGVGDTIFFDASDRTVTSRVRADPSGLYWSDVSDDGRILATAGESSTVGLWDVATGAAIGIPLEGLDSIATTVDINPGGSMVAAGSESGQLLVWDLGTGRILGGSMPGPTSDDYVTAFFTPDGRGLVVVSSAGSGWLWDVDLAAWSAQACGIAGRDLTQTEWDSMLPNRPYHATCGY
jgi:WD40 repeat protein/DNA-binding SARP family transcriptional activator